MAKPKNKKGVEMNIDYIAKLSNLPLLPDEREKFSEELAEIVKYVSELSEVDTKGIKPFSNASNSENVFFDRKDNAAGFSQKEALSNAPKTYEGYVAVPLVLKKRTVK